MNLKIIKSLLLIVFVCNYISPMDQCNNNKFFGGEGFNYDNVSVKEFDKRFYKNQISEQDIFNKNIGKIKQLQQKKQKEFLSKYQLLVDTIKKNSFFEDGFLNKVFMYYGDQKFQKFDLPEKRSFHDAIVIVLNKKADFKSLNFYNRDEIAKTLFGLSLFLSFPYEKFYYNNMLSFLKDIDESQYQLKGIFIDENSLLSKECMINLLNNINQIK